MREPLESRHSRSDPSGWLERLFQNRSCQPACKPGSVWPRRLAAPRRGGHSSWTRVATRLTQPTRTAGRKLPRGLPLVPSLFGLAPGGVCRAAPVARRAVGSYPTLSPLPRRDPKAGRAVCFLWHFPWGRPRRTLSGTVFPWSPDFPHPQPFGSRGCGRPAGWQGDKGVCCEKRNRNRQPTARRGRRRPDARFTFEQ